MAFGVGNRVSLTEFNDKAEENVQQDQSARKFSLIFLYNLRKISPWS